jgi:hypothetical protein
MKIVYHGGTEVTELDKILIDEIFSLCPPCLGGAISESLCLCEEIIHHGGTEYTEMGLTTEARSARRSK